jgi:hypothetical protein
MAYIDDDQSKVWTGKDVFSVGKREWLRASQQSTSDRIVSSGTESSFNKLLEISMSGQDKDGIISLCLGEESQD